MITSIGLVIFVGFVIGYLFKKIHIPSLVGMIVAGFLMGPFVLNILSENLLNEEVSSVLRQIALVIILTNSGLNLDIASLKKIGRPAILLSFVPALFEIVGITIGAYFILKITVFEGLLLGSVLAAVSPAVVSPRMITLIKKGIGERTNIPKLILAGSSVDDIFVIVLFYANLGLVKNNSFSFSSLMQIPVSIILGILLGIVVGFILCFIIKKMKFSKSINFLIVFSVSLLLVGFESLVKPYVAVSSLLSVIVLSIIILYKNKETAKDLSESYHGVWEVFKIILFVLIGAKVNFSVLGSVGINYLAVLIIGLLFRSCGVFVSIIGTGFNFKEKLFCIISYIPKATVQASIGAIALDEGLAVGNLILTMSVLAICITAFVGDILIKHLANPLLKEQVIEQNV